MTAVDLSVPATTGVRNRALFCVGLALSAVVLLMPAIWNGFPLLQYDTGGYLARWFEGYLVPSRPAAYGLLLAAAVPWHFWPVLFVQTATTIWIVWLLLRAHGLTHSPIVLPTLIVVLSATTTLPWLTAILLTDIFAGLAVVALYLCVFTGETLSRSERIGLVFFIAFATATHSATYAVVLVLAVMALAAVVAPRRLVPCRGAMNALAAAFLGTVMTYGANYAVSGQIAWTPGGYSILFGRMLQDGIVPHYLNDHCPERELKLCDFRSELPHDADTFLWGGSVFDQLGRFTGMREEMRTIVLGSLAAYPGEQIRTAVIATARQLVRVRSGEGVGAQMWHTYGIIERYTPSLKPYVRAARQQHGAVHFGMLNRIHEPVALVSIALLAALLLGAWRVPALVESMPLIATVGSAILVNAFVCGALANPHDRYGARMAWIATVAVVVTILCAFRQRAGTEREPPPLQVDANSLHAKDIAAHRGNA